MSRAHLDLLLRLHPRGSLNLDLGTTAYQELESWGDVVDLVDAQADSLLDELLPDRSVALLSRWEVLYDLHRVSGLTDAERGQRVVARKRRLENCRPLTIANILTTVSGLAVLVVEPHAFRTNDTASLTDSAADVIDGGLAFWVEVDETLARLSSADRIELQEELDAVSPAHTLGIVQCNDFMTDDEWSLCDRDLLAS